MFTQTYAMGPRFYKPVSANYLWARLNSLQVRQRLGGNARQRAEFLFVSAYFLARAAWSLAAQVQKDYDCFPTSSVVISEHVWRAKKLVVLDGPVNFAYFSYVSSGVHKLFTFEPSVKLLSLAWAFDKFWMRLRSFPDRFSLDSDNKVESIWCS